MSWFTGALKVVYPKCVWSIDKEDRVFLTFDDGPTPEITNWTLNELQKYEAKATFFCIGDNLRKSLQKYEMSWKTFNKLLL